MPRAAGIRPRRRPRRGADDPPHWLRKVILFLERADGQPARLDARAVRRVLVPHDRRTSSGVVMMLAALFGFLPQAVISIFGGVWADRHNRKYLIMVADAAIAASTLALALIMLSGLRRGVADLPDDGGPLRRRRHPDAGGVGAHPADHPDAQSDAGERHQRLDPVGDGPARARRGRGDLRLVVGRERRLCGIPRADLLHRRGDCGHRHRPARAHSRRRRPTRRRRADRILRRPRRRRALRRAPRVRALAAGAVRDHLRADRGALQPHAADARAHVRRRRAAERDQPRGARDLVQRRAWCSAASSSRRSSPSAAASA